MNYKYKNPKELKEKFQLDLVNVFDINNVDDLLADVKENGILGKVTLANNGNVLDGHRLILVAEILGIDVPYMESDLDATVENRIALNNQRVKSWLDLRNEYLIVFDTFGKKQGQRSEDDLVKYSRSDEISKRVKNRFKDPKTINCAEWILKNDNGDFPMSWWLIEKKGDVAPIYDLMKLSLEEKGFKEIFKLVQEKKLSPKSALQQIEYQKKLAEAKSQNFQLPESSETVAKIYNGEPEEVLVDLKDESIKLIFFEAEKYTPIVTVSKIDGDYKVHQTPDTYGTKIGTRVKPFTSSRLSKYGSLIVGIKESYFNGFAQQIPFHAIGAIVKETGMFYKQTLYVSGNESFVSKKGNENLPDDVTHLLWFVKSTGDMTFNNPLFIKNQGEEDELGSSMVYKVCSNHLNSQSLSDMILKDKQVVKGSKQDLDPSYIIPIYMTTNENDTVLDLTMKSDIQSAAILMNRKFIGVTASKPVYESVGKRMGTISKEYKSELTKKLFSVPNPKTDVKPKSATIKSKQTT